ncbi:hypothetical protein HD554DRAFT_2176817 [Boletus coccyginus]|nr:hypothetical protein HD554DRAFT_2176817 [Boletus coccyginus]
MRCSHLRTLIASCLCTDEVQLDALRALPLGSITHPWLGRIEIKVIRAGLDAIFNALTLPALEELDVSFCYRERDAWPHAAFVEIKTVPYSGEYMEAMPGLAVFTSATSPLSR